MQTKSRYSLLRITIVLCLFAVVLVPAHSQVTTTKSIDEPGRHPYQAFVSVAIAQNFLNGSASLPAVPAGRRLVIDYVSAEISDVVTDLERLQVTLITFGGGQGGNATLLGTEALDQNVAELVRTPPAPAKRTVRPTQSYRSPGGPFPARRQDAGRSGFA